MRTVVVYESMYGNTRRIAEAIAEGLDDRDAIVVPVGHADEAAIGSADLVVIGGPTHAFGMSRPQTRLAAVRDAGKHALTVEPEAARAGLREWLETAALRGKAVAAFDTRVKQAGFLGHAANKLDRALRERHAVVVAPAESFLVTKQTALVDGELDRARRWGAALRTAAAARTHQS